MQREKDDIYHETNNNEDFCHCSSPVGRLLLRVVFSLSSHRISPAKRSSVLFLLGACSDTLSQLSTLTAGRPRSPAAAHLRKPRWWKEISRLQSLLKDHLTDEGICTICTVFNEPHYLTSHLLALLAEEFPHFFFCFYLLGGYSFSLTIKKNTANKRERRQRVRNSWYTGRKRKAANDLKLWSLFPADAIKI